MPTIHSSIPFPKRDPLMIDQKRVLCDEMIRLSSLSAMTPPTTRSSHSLEAVHHLSLAGIDDALPLDSRLQASPSMLKMHALLVPPVERAFPLPPNTH